MPIFIGTCRPPPEPTISSEARSRKPRNRHAVQRENAVTTTATIRELADKECEYGFVTA